ncbi:hypothetical protein APU18_23490, partial [Escherichia coli]|uniref:hypothetical protein n=1 Tax=Escherichia coli TaxID=562 RepID=UPI00073BBBD7
SISAQISLFFKQQETTDLGATLEKETGRLNNEKPKKGEHNSPRSKNFFDGVKKFFDDLTR